MGRPSKIPFKITPVICRYLRDIQFEKENIDDPTIKSSPGNWFLVSTWKNNEEYTSESEQNLEGMKSYLTKKGIARFPTFQDYEDKLGIKFSDEASMGDIHDPSTNEWFVFEKSFPVEVLNLEALRGFRKTYCLKEESGITSQFASRQKLKLEGNTLTFPERKSYTFKGQKALRLFNQLWEDREHFVKGESKPDKTGDPRTLIKFMLKVKLASTDRASRDVSEAAKDEIRGVVGNARRDLNGKGLSIKLECKAEKVLLTIKEK